MIPFTHTPSDTSRLTAAMRPVMEVLEAATGSQWHAEHTGGGCMWLATYPTVPDGCWMLGVDETWPMIAVTALDALGWDDTPASCRDRWTIGMYPEGQANSEAAEMWDEVGDEVLPMVARRAAERIREVEQDLTTATATEGR